MDERDRNKLMLKGPGFSRTYGMKKRYVVCKDCGEIKNIAKQQDTSGGYLCPDCTAKRRKKHGKKNAGRIPEKI